MILLHIKFNATMMNTQGIAFTFCECHLNLYSLYYPGDSFHFDTIFLI